MLATPLKALVSYRPSIDEMKRARRDLETEREALKNSTYGVKMRQSDFLKRAETGKLPLVWAPAEVLADNPLKVINPEAANQAGKVTRDIRGFLEAAQGEILMISPYLVPGKAGLRWYQMMRERGVTMKIITNSLASTDSLVAQFGYMRYRKDLLRMGVVLYELKPKSGLRRDEDEDEPPGEEHHLRLGSSSHGALHAKLLVLDRQAVFIGSFNLDPRSAKFDTQDGIIIHSPKLAGQAAGLFARIASPAQLSGQSHGRR